MLFSHCFFDWKIGVFQQTVVRVYCIQKFISLGCNKSLKVCIRYPCNNFFQTSGGFELASSIIFRNDYLAPFFVLFKMSIMLQTFLTLWMIYLMNWISNDKPILYISEFWYSNISVVLCFLISISVKYSFTMMQGANFSYR